MENKELSPQEEAILSSQETVETPVIEEQPLPQSPVEDPTAEAPASAEPTVAAVEAVSEEPAAILSEEEAQPGDASSDEKDPAVPAAEQTQAHVPTEESPVPASVLPDPVPQASVLSDTQLQAQVEAAFHVPELNDPELDALIEHHAPVPDPEPLQEVPMAQEYRDAPIPEEEPPVHAPHVKKGRPKRRRKEILFGLPGIAAVAIWLAITVVIGVTLGRMIWVCAADVLAFGREDKPVTITVYQSDSIEIIADKLHKGGLIKYPGLFKFYAGLAVDEGEIQPGIWDLNTRYDYHALVSMMSAGSTREVIKVTIPEGYSCRQIFALLEENRVATATDLAAWAAEGELDEYWFLENVERGSKYCLEGFLFPDTYEFYKNSSPREALERMLDNFDHRFDEDMQAQVAALNEHISAMMREDGRSEEYIASHQFGVHEVVIVASLIEKETASNEESPSIASVIYNRLFRWGDTPSYLNIDASVIYALDGKTDLTSEDLRVDSPYNTYLNTGLTPGAISNPGLASIKAALHPAETGYYFYVLDPALGSHHFSTTYEEHNEFIASLE